MAKNSVNTEQAEVIENGDREEGGGFLLGNLRLLGLIGLGLLVVVGAVAYFLITGAKGNDEAQLMLARIRPYYDRGEFAIAINGDSAKDYGGQKVRGLLYIVNEWGTTPAGRIAALYLGNSYVALGQPEKAKGPYENATDAESDLIRSAAHAGLGAVAEAARNYDQAASEFEKAASEDRLELNTAEYLVAAARNYEHANKVDEAIKHYRTVATQYSSSPANAAARMALARRNQQL